MKQSQFASEKKYRKLKKREKYEEEEVMYLKEERSIQNTQILMTMFSLDSIKKK